MPETQVKNLSVGNLVSFQEIWMVAAGLSSIQDPKLVQTDLFKSIDHLKLALDYFKPYSQSSINDMKKNRKMSENLQKFVIRSAELLNLDCCQMHDVVRQFARFHFRGSKQKLQQMLGEEKNTYQLMSLVAEYYFTDRLYCLRCFTPMIAYFQDAEHPFKDVYAEILSNLPDIMATATKQFESLFSAENLKPSSRGKDCTAEVQSQLGIQRIKEQCEILQLFLLYYSHFEMPCETLVKLAKIFKEYNFGANHPISDVIDPRLLDPLLNSMNALMQVLLIEGFDLEFLQEPDASSEHQLSKDKKSMKILDDLVLSLIGESSLSPLLLSWATVRFVLMEDNGGVMTQKLGERSVDMNVWRETAHVVSTHPFNTDSNVSSTGKRVLRGILSCVTKSFHEDTLGCYSDLVALAIMLLSGETMEAGRGLAGFDLDALLLSSVGYFPLNIGPMLDLLTSMAGGGEAAVVQIHAFLSSLPTFAEYLTTCHRDEVESMQDESCWRLLCNKPISVASGTHTVKLNVGTVGQLVNTQQGAIVQWQQSTDAWKVFDAEIKSLLKYKGPSSNYYLLGYIEKALLVFRLVERILTSLQSCADPTETGVMAVIERAGQFVAHVPALIQKIMQMTEPATDLLATCVRCHVALVRIDPGTGARAALTDLAQIQYLPSSDKLTFSESNQIYPGIFGQLLTEWERVNGEYPVTMATVDLLTELLEYSMTHDEKMTSYLTHSVAYVTKEVFCCLLKWQRNEDLWDKIGVRCLKLFHAILRLNVADVTESGAELQKTVVTSLTEQSGAEVLLKIASVRVDLLQAVFVNQPFSASTNELTEIVRLSLSALTNLLRLCPDLQGFDDTFLHRILAAPNVGDSTVIASIAGYIYHRHTSALPKLSLAILRQVALLAPMSLHANLGSDVVGFRDILLSRLQSRTEHHPIKIAILDFMVVSVQTQPGLLELFIDLEPKDKDKPESGYKLGKSSFLHAILGLIEPAKQGTYRLPNPLHASCLKFINALWVGKRHTVMQALKESDKAFWNSILLPLFSDNSPKETAQNELLETCAHSLNVLALESFYMSHATIDKTLAAFLKEFKEKKRYQHWSKVLLCVSKSLSLVESAERERHLMFTAAWQTFVATGNISDVIVLKSILDDILASIVFLVEDADSPCRESSLLLQLCSDLLLTLVHRSTKEKRRLSDAQSYLERVVLSLQRLCERGQFTKTSLHLHTTAYHLMAPASEPGKAVASDLVIVTCHHLTLLLRNHDAELTHFTIQAAIVLIQTLERLYENDKGEVNQSWLDTVSHESTIHLLMAVMVRLTEPCHDKRENSTYLCIAILRLLTHVAGCHEVALAIQRTRCLPQLFLNLANAYNTKSKKWLNVYHMSLHFVSRMADSLSHDFVDDTLDFLGIHQDRIIQSISALPVNQSELLTREVDHTVALLASASRKYVHQWRFKLKKLFDVIHDLIMTSCQATVALLLHPRLLQEKIRIRERKQTKTSTSTPTHATISSQLSTKAAGARLSGLKDDETPSREMSSVQKSLVSILGSCLTFLKNLSPDICQVMLDPAFVPDEYPRLLTINFATPTLEQSTPASFGGLVSAANFALSTLHKIDSGDSGQSSYRDALTYVADVSLLLVMSQCLLLLNQSDVSHRSKQLLRRELGDELSSCVRSASRHLRHSSSSYSPQSSPVSSQPVQTGFGRLQQDGGAKSVLNLVSEYVKQVLR